MLGLRRPHQPPHRRTGQVRHVLAGQRDRAAGQHHQRPGPIGPGTATRPTPHGWRRTPIRAHARPFGGGCHTTGAASMPVSVQRNRRPHDLQEFAATGPRRGGRQLLGRHRTRHQLPHRQHRQPRRIGELHRHGALARRRQPHPDPRRPRRMQDTPLARRTARRSAARWSATPSACKAASNTTGWIPKPPHRHTGVLRGLDLGEGLGPPPPHLPQAPKGRAVPVAAPRQLVVGAGHIDRRRRPTGGHTADPRRARVGPRSTRPRHATPTPNPLGGSRIHRDGRGIRSAPAASTTT